MSGSQKLLKWWIRCVNEKQATNLRRWSGGITCLLLFEIYGISKNSLFLYIVLCSNLTRVTLPKISVFLSPNFFQPVKALSKKSDFFSWKVFTNISFLQLKVCKRIVLNCKNLFYQWSVTKQANSYLISKNSRC